MRGLLTMRSAEKSLALEDRITFEKSDFSADRIVSRPRTVRPRDALQKQLNQ